ncbi:peptidoglycan-associated lipoprotein [Abyssogena phaseoliformis symbiont OG214]|uniref:OmpA family protein n=1 Tax=Abyssogena phaseoliformis symbiont TaxID=596095 RepID=UPI0019154F9E|nr:OmpA family protein [Abyssogena phaseoliformis symbiont]MBW5289234.1 18K peptidoglycan-associated outer membrane lipoprotein [Candidatus Ruthia sp. Apha_13_S6]BBB22738.1 peptidoglycan-associated lipoprotein [Abyssogena phaseoliformis symbiont OG214]
MLKIMSVTTTIVLLSSCSSVDDLYKKVLPKPSVATIEDRTENTQENVIEVDQSSFQSQGFSKRSVNTSGMVEPVVVADFRNTDVSFVLYFSYDGTEIDEDSTKQIIKHVNFMSNNPALNLRLEGHTDERGTREYNLALGENRALSVKEILGLYDLSLRVEVISFGEEKPILQRHDEDAWQKNRRVEFVYQ